LKLHDFPGNNSLLLPLQGDRLAKFLVKSKEYQMKFLKELDKTKN